MTTCTIPPKGWTCSRDAGHDGPCAASQEPFPYEVYVDQAVQNLKTFRMNYHWAGGDYDQIWAESMSLRELRGLLTDAWLAGLGYSLNIIETEKTKRTLTELEKQYEGKPQCDWPWP